MATTLTNVQAGVAYRETQAQIWHELDTLKAQLQAHQLAASNHGIDWGHVGDLTQILEQLQCLTQIH